MRAELPASPRKRAVAVEGLASEYGYQVKKFRSNSENPNKDKIKQFYCRSDNVYTMPGKGGEMTVWNEEGKQKLQKYYLTLYLKEGYALYLETCENNNEKCSFSTFCNLRPKNVLLLGDSPKEQCKCQIHENLFLKLETMGAPTNVPGGKRYYAPHPQTAHAGTTHALNVKMEKNSYRERRWMQWQHTSNGMLLSSKPIKFEHKWWQDIQEDCNCG